MSAPAAAFPDGRDARARFIAARRPPKNALDPARPYGLFVEEEPVAPGETVPVATIFLTNRECAYRCTMCDLWKNTLDEPTPRGAVPEQVRFALERLPAARHVKLYNSGSFFDRAAIPAEDRAAVAELVKGFDRVVVECHPDLVNDDVLRFRDLLGGAELEVAVGLETANADALEKINKGMTIADFEDASRFLVTNGIRLRSFILVGIPFLPRDEQTRWLIESVRFSFECESATVSLIPTRLGNGTLEELRRQGVFTPPGLRDLERALEDFFEGEERGAGAPGLLLADLWNASELPAPSCCASARIERLRSMNHLQRNLPRPACPEGIDHAAREGRG